MNATPVTHMRIVEPYRVDNYVRYGARAAKSAAPQAKYLATAENTSLSSAKRRRIGDVTSPYTHVLVLFHNLAAGEKTTALPLLMESWSVVISHEFEKMTDLELVLCHEGLSDGEHDLEARENKARQRKDLRTSTAEQDRAAADAGLDEAAVEVARSSIERIVADRKERRVWTLGGRRI